MLTRTEKEQIVENLAGVFKQKKPVIFANYQGVKMDELAKWRKELPAEFHLQVVKNTLLKLGAKKSGVELPNEIFGQPLSILIGSADEVETSKLPYQWSRESEKYQIIGGIIKDEFVDADKIIKLAKLPSREQLQAQLIWSMKSLFYRLTNTLAYNGRALTCVITQIQNAKSKIQSEN